MTSAKAILSLGVVFLLFGCNNNGSFSVNSSSVEELGIASSTSAVRPATESSPTAVPNPSPVPTPSTVPSPGPAPLPAPLPMGSEPCIDTLGGPEKIFREEVCKLVNQARSQAGLLPLTLDSGRSKVAHDYAIDMTTRDFFNHTDPDGKGPGDRLRVAGIPYSTYGENIAAGQRTPQNVMTTWMNSPGHRANILGKNFRRLGVGYFDRYWVQVFTN